jgi:hypothetical protein
MGIFKFISAKRFPNGLVRRGLGGASVSSVVKSLFEGDDLDCGQTRKTLTRFRDIMNPVRLIV